MADGCAWVSCSRMLLGVLLMASVVEAAPPGNMLRREVPGDLPLVADGRALVTIVAPEEEAMQSVAADLAAFVKGATGCDVPVVADADTVEADGRTAKAEFRQRHLILVGNALNNRAILPLYCRWLDAADGAYPGGEGYELRTVVNPYGTGCHELILGASTEAGARAGLEALKARLTGALRGQDLTLPQVLEVRVGDRLKPTFDQAIAEVKANPQRAIGAVLTNTDLANLANDALKYAWTGERAFAERAAGVLREMNRRFDGTYYHGDVRTCDDYALEYAVRGWLVLQHAGVLTADELAETDRNLYRDFPLSAHGPGNVGSRHLASGSMAWFLALDGLLTYGNPDAEARAQLETWREGVRAYFRGACKTYRGDVDQAQDYGALENVFRYAIHDGYWEYFTSGWADKTIAQMLMNVDNLGWYSGVGGYGESMPGSLNYPVAIGVCLPITAMVERRGDLRWVKENVPNLGMSHLGFQVLGVHAFDPGPYVPATAPRGAGWPSAMRPLPEAAQGEQQGAGWPSAMRPLPEAAQGALTGLTVLPLSEYHWKLAQSPITDGVGPVTTPVDRCVDKVMLREGCGRNDQYLLLNGFQNTVMGCVDGNAIVRFCDQGEVCLFQSTQEEGHDTKNAVWVSNGRNDEPLEGCVERGPMADLGEVCFSSTRLPRYHGTDWERNLFWRKGGVLVVMDRVKVEQPGRYVMACTWRSPRYARLTDRGRWEARTERGVFTVASTERPPSSKPYGVAEGRDGETSIPLSPDSRLTSSLGNDRFAAEVPWVLREWKRLDGKAGQVVDFGNAVYYSTEAKPQDYDLLRVGDGAVLLVDRRSPGSALLTRGAQSLGDDLAVDSDFAWIESGTLRVAGLRQLGIGKAMAIAADAPPDLTLRAEKGSVSLAVHAAAQTTLTLSLPDLRGAQLDGAPVNAVNGVLRVALSPGAHTLVCEANGDLALAAAQRALSAAETEARPKARTEKPEAPGVWPLRSVWTYDGFRSNGRRERNLTVTSQADDAEPQAGPYAVLTDTLFRHTISADVATTWKADRVRLTLELPGPEPTTGLRLRNYYGTTDFEKTKPNPYTITEIALSDDGFRADVRPLSRPTTRRYQYLRGCYGSQFFSEVVDEVAGMRETATAIRITLAKPEGLSQIRLGAVELLVDGIGDSVPLKARAIRWGTGNADVWVVWHPDRGRLAVLDSGGELLWEKDLCAAITGVCCADVDGDGVNELPVTAADWKVRLFDQAGNERVVKDWRGVYEQTGGKYYYGGMPHGVGVYDVPGQKQKDLAIGHYYFLTTLGLDGQIKKTYEGYACYWQDFMDSGVDLTGDGQRELLAYSETPWQTKVPVAIIDGAKQEPLPYFPAGNGGARLFQMLRIGDEDCVAVGSHKGCGIYSLTKRAYKWYLAGEVFRSSFLLTDLEGDGTPEMLIGQRDGFLQAVNIAGEIVRQIDVGEEVLAVGAVPTAKGLTLLASTASGTRCYDAEGRLSGTSPLVVQRFDPATHEGRPALLALHLDGRVELLTGEGSP